MGRRIFVCRLDQKVVRASRQVAYLVHVNNRPLEVKKEWLIIGIDRVKQLVGRDSSVELRGDGANFLAAL